MYLSPNIKASDFNGPLGLSDKIEVFTDRVIGWQLGIALTCEGIPHSGFAVLHILFSYFEMIGKYMDGFAQAGASEKYFQKGIESVYAPITQLPYYVRHSIYRDLYRGARCGMYHAGFTLPYIAIVALVGGDFRYDPNTKRTIIDPHSLACTIRSHFQKYSEELAKAENVALRSAFERRFDYEAQHDRGSEFTDFPQFDPNPA
jgi:hypothetical protein